MSDMIADTPPAPPATQVPAAQPRAMWRPFIIISVLLLFAGEALLAAGEFYGWQTISRAKPAPDDSLALTALQAQLTMVEKSTMPAAAATTTVPGALTANLASMAAQLSALESQTGADHAALASLQANSTNFASLPQKLARLVAVQRAALALQAGQPLGAIPGAPPALTAFADTAPPTPAALLLSFPAAARAGAAASIDGARSSTIWSRFLARLENLITISDGNHVILGAPAAAVIAQAQQDLDAGDLAGAVTRLGTLSQTTQTAMAGWLNPARALLAAQYALLKMTSQTE